VRNVSTEHGWTTFTVGSQWTLVSAPLTITQSGHYALRAQIYEGTTGYDYNFDGAQLVNDGLSNASWEDGSWAPWSVLPNGGGTVNYAAESGSTAQEGGVYGASDTTTAAGSVYQDVSASPSPGQSYTFSVWIRSKTGNTLTGTLALWALGANTD